MGAADVALAHQLVTPPKVAPSDADLVCWGPFGVTKVSADGGSEAGAKGSAKRAATEIDDRVSEIPLPDEYAGRSACDTPITGVAPPPADDDMRLAEEEAARIELEDVRGAQELAEALHAQEVAEAQELLEAQEAVLREDLGLDPLRPTAAPPQENSSSNAVPTKPYAPVDMMARRLDEEEADKAKVDAFLKSNGFSDVDAKRTRMLKSSYPLHAAVSQNNAEMVQLLLAAGARHGLKNSAGQTPLQLAQRLDKRDSHALVLKLLRFSC
jgi:hypothetical protein